jgi:hypothetical protein
MLQQTDSGNRERRAMLFPKITRISSKFRELRWIVSIVQMPRSLALAVL